MHKIFEFFDRLMQGIIITTIAGIVGVICLQVFCRFVLNNALSWPEEAARFLMVWSLFLAAGYVLLERGHASLRFFVNWLSPRQSVILNIIIHILIFIFLIVVTIGGWQESMSLINMKTGALRISRAIPHFIIPVSGVFYICVSVRLVIEDIQKWRNS